MSQDPAPLGYSFPSENKSAGFAIASMVLGIVSLLLCLWFIAFPSGILAIIFGVIAGKKAKTGEGGGAGMAKAGFVMGCTSVSIFLLLIILFFGFSHFATTKTTIAPISPSQRSFQPLVPASPSSPRP